MIVCPASVNDVLLYEATQKMWFDDVANVVWLIICDVTLGRIAGYDVTH